MNLSAAARVARPFLVALLGYLLTGGVCLALEPLVVKSGDTLPIYLSAEALAEAQNPTVDPAQSGGGFWNPGPERFYGWALRDLSEYLEKMTGAEFPLTRVGDAPGPAIFAGTFEQFPGLRLHHVEAMSSPDPESFIVEVHGNKLYILGKSNFGLIAGIYGLLDYLGCKWYAPGQIWENVPDLRRGLSLDQNLKLASAGPSYKTRLFFPGWGPNTSVFRPGQRQREFTFWDLRNRNGGSAYTANFHNDHGMISPDLFTDRPELFALVNGQRNSYALSRADPEVITMVIDKAVAYLKENAGRGSFYDSFSVETNDGSAACEWSLQKMAQENLGKPTPTDLNYWFANQIAAGLDRAGLTDKWVGMCSYSDHAEIPSFDLHPRVSVVVTAGLASTSLTLEQRLRGLAERKAQRLGVYEYLNFIIWSQEKPGCHPAADPVNVASNLRNFYKHGANFYMAETSDSWISSGAGHFMASRIMWDIERDAQRELEAYYQGAFGPAAGPVRALYEDWTRFPRRPKLVQGMLHSLPRITRAKSALWHSWIRQADELVERDAKLKARVNQIKRYYLYLDLMRQYETEFVDEGTPSKEQRFKRIFRYVGAHRGEGAFHALGLFATLMYNAQQLGYRLDDWGPEYAAISRNLTDEQAWMAFEPLTDAEIDRMFAEAEIPLDPGQPARHAELAPRLLLWPAQPKAPSEIVFPKLHGPPGVERHYLIQVMVPTPRLTLDVVASNPLGGGTQERTCIFMDATERSLHRWDFSINTPTRFELTDIKPGVYTVVFPEFGGEQLTVRGGNCVGAVRAFDDSWGFNPVIGGEVKEAHSYFVVPPGRRSLRAKLTYGAVSLGFMGGPVIAEKIEPITPAGSGGKPLPTQPWQTLNFDASEGTRVARVTWNQTIPSTQGLVIEGVTLFSPDPSRVLYESR